MGEANIATAIAGARDYLRANRDDARYRDPPATAVIEDGLRVRTTGTSGESVTTDMVPSVGGGGSAPSPGWLMRAANASCIATLIAMRAAEEQIDLGELEVTVDSESDDYGILGIDDAVPAGPLTMRVSVRVASTAPADVVNRVVEWGVVHCPVCDAIKRPVPVELQVEVR